MSPDALLELWNAAVAGDLPAHRLDRRALESRPLEETDVRLELRDGRPVGFVAVAGPGKPWLEGDTTGHVRLLAVHPEHRRQGVASGLLEWAEATLRSQGATRIVLGGEARHYLAGVPLKAEAALALFERRGYSLLERVSSDLARDLDTLPPLEVPPGANVEVAEPGAVLEFVAREFPGRWVHEVRWVLERDARQALALTLDGRVEGFAAVGLRADTSLLPSCLWPTEDCGLGPMGVSRGLRGRGLGRVLLVGAMHALRERGGRRMGIDWTDVEGFYESAGFGVVRQYRHLEKTV